MSQKWTDDLVLKAVSEVVSSIGRMPTNSELCSMGLGSVASQIVKRGGFSHFAKQLGAESLYSDSHFGWDGEILAKSLLELNGFTVEVPPHKRAPFDLLVNGLARIDVKTANFARYGPCSGWFYRIGKIPQSDLIMLLQYDTKDIYIIPWKLCPSSNITISKSGGKYASFKNNFELVSKLIDAMKSFYQL